MKKFLIFNLLLILFVSFSVSSFSQNKFAGKVEIALKDKSGDNSMDYYIKGNKIRMDIQSPQGEARLILDQENKKISMLMPSMKMYMSFPWDKMVSGAQGNNDNKNNMSFKKTGETKTINGYKCEKWLMTGDEGTTEAWMTDELGRFMFFDSPMSGKSKPEWQQELSNGNNFPMLIIHKDSDGNENRLEVTKVEKMDLSDDFFGIPSGYNEMKMPIGGQK
ncbi:MAG TPA: DUF4412 domain-containing protein [Ignavibacteriaceae bacterium]|nr:DUF4412 domain-containing protein [Ignavibacteriaceae bacterium]